MGGHSANQDPKIVETNVTMRFLASYFVKMHSLFCIQYTVSILTVTQKCPYTKMPIRDRMHPAGQEEVHCVLGGSPLRARPRHIHAHARRGAAASIASVEQRKFQGPARCRSIYHRSRPCRHPLSARFKKQKVHYQRVLYQSSWLQYVPL